MNQKTKLPYILSILLFSLLVLSSLIFVIFILLALHQDQFIYLHETYSSYTFELSLLSQLYAPFVFIMVYIFSIIMMLLHKKFAYYLFFLLNFFLLIILSINPPIHFLNMSLIILVNLIIYWQYSVYNKLKLSQELAINDD